MVVQIVRSLTKQRLITALLLVGAQFEQVDGGEYFRVAEFGESAQGRHDRLNEARLLKGLKGGKAAGHGNFKQSFALFNRTTSFYNQISPLCVVNVHILRVATLGSNKRQTARPFTLLPQGVLKT